MKEIIKKIFEKWACKHNWEVHFTTALVEYEGAMVHGRKRTLICENCGKIKRITL